MLVVHRLVNGALALDLLFNWSIRPVMGQLWTSMLRPFVCRVTLMTVLMFLIRVATMLPDLHVISAGTEHVSGPSARMLGSAMLNSVELTPNMCWITDRHLLRVLISVKLRVVRNFTVRCGANITGSSSIRNVTLPLTLSRHDDIYADLEAVQTLILSLLMPLRLCNTWTILLQMVVEFAQLCATLPADYIGPLSMVAMNFVDDRLQVTLMNELMVELQFVLRTNITLGSPLEMLIGLWTTIRACRTLFADGSPVLNYIDCLFILHLLCPVRRMLFGPLNAMLALVDSADKARFAGLPPYGTVAVPEMNISRLTRTTKTGMAYTRWRYCA